MADKETVTLATRTKAGGKIWPEGEQKVPAGLVETLREAGVLVEDAAPEPPAEIKPPVTVEPGEPPVIEGLTPEQVTMLQNAIKGMAADDLTQNGVPKVAPLNAALKQAEAGFEVNAKQIAAAMPKADADSE